ncbi:uncharacterized protein DUF4291 [Flavobacterium sp. 90]|uniref:DUF4291 family protein n=1 Tax=unclassified Flavobacterium TaxID=196869 RepID=UPI000EAC4F6B|nr:MULTISPECIES: DUF4291 family protein [unclassified Flavobacterium]RKR05606.1 uncharacterized protein DUF4291 [Flavobacterium sp. 81]TCK56922.1 uncharacterized protein DUF4291 [Flavobacterium sp. 90]
MNQRETDLITIKKFIAEKDGDGFFNSKISFIHVYEDDEEILLLLCQIFESDWHKDHEYMARDFQEISNPLTAESLFKVAFSDFEYLRWNEYFPLQRKCTWALADIGTNEAKKYLEQIEEQANETIAKYAIKRLDLWDFEFRRKVSVLGESSYKGFAIALESYSERLKELPQNGQNIIGYLMKNLHTIDTPPYNYIAKEYIVLYLVNEKSTAASIIESQDREKPDYSSLKANSLQQSFLSIIHNYNSREKENQESVLAIWIKKEVFKEILQKVTPNWNPDYDYFGKELERQTIQLDLKEEDFEKLIKENIEFVFDISDFIKEQKQYISQNQIDKLMLPKERIVDFETPELIDERWM